jgi:hypothetical protein
MDRGSTLFEDDDGTFFLWKNCEVPDCPNGVCYGLDERYCHPHQPGADVLRRLNETVSAESLPQVANLQYRGLPVFRQGDPGIRLLWDGR